MNAAPNGEIGSRRRSPSHRTMLQLGPEQKSTADQIIFPYLLPSKQQEVLLDFSKHAPAPAYGHIPSMTGLPLYGPAPPRQACTLGRTRSSLWPNYSRTRSAVSGWTWAGMPTGLPEQAARLPQPPSVPCPPALPWRLALPLILHDEIIMHCQEEKMRSLQAARLCQCSKWRRLIHT